MLAEGAEGERMVSDPPPPNSREAVTSALTQPVSLSEQAAKITS